MSAGAARQFWLRLLFRTCDRYPLVVHMIAPIIVWGTWIGSRSVRETVILNGRRIFGAEASRRHLARYGRAMIGHFLASILELVVVSYRDCASVRRAIPTAVEGLDSYLRARSAGRGAVLVTAHLGSFESALRDLRIHEAQVHVVFKRDEFPVFDELRARQRRMLGVHEAPIDDGLANWARLRDALMEDEVVLFQGDRVMPGQRGRRVLFLHGTLEVPVGPLKLARLTGSPVIPVFAEPAAGGAACIRITEPIWPGPEPGPGEDDPDILEIAARIEKLVRRFPEHWLILHRAFCEDFRTGGPQTR